MDSTGDYREIGEVAEVEEGTTPTSIAHIDEKRSVSIDVKIDEEKTNLSDVAGEIQTKVDKIDLPKGYNVYYGGEYEQMVDIFTQLVMALLLAIGLVYMIMAAQFGSLKYPFIIMFTIPLAAIGVLVALFITKTALSITAFFGIIMLVGIVVNNAIVLIDYINTLRERGLPIREALLTGGQERLRPVLMTMATTVLAMTPIAIGFGGGKMMGPMAISVMGGLSFSTFLTLAFIPVLYSLFTGERRETKALVESAKAE
jgi:HAE1 family hydrophobic/amphiphilic exporter-1